MHEPLASCLDHKALFGYFLGQQKVTIKKEAAKDSLYLFADRTGLEPATSAVTGRHSNQLNYRSSAINLEGAKLKKIQLIGYSSFSTYIKDNTPANKLSLST